jgi:hypothetical protein
MKGFEPSTFAMARREKVAEARKLGRFDSLQYGLAACDSPDLVPKAVPTADMVPTRYPR